MVKPYFFSSVDSIMLLEEGFQLTSVDLSDKMLKYALKTRWRRRKETAFDNWGKLRIKVDKEKEDLLSVSRERRASVLMLFFTLRVGYNIDVVKYFGFKKCAEVKWAKEGKYRGVEVD